uniref:Uncharacterized protein n=1 Tax=Nymphaea colorata TaxID=210225 RepID=A0A5K1CM14_9MAGN
MRGAFTGHTYEQERNYCQKTDPWLAHLDITFSGTLVGTRI